MNNISIKNINPVENIFRFRCRYCDSNKLDIHPINYPYYKSSSNINTFITEGTKPCQLVDAIKCVEESLAHCNICHKNFTFRYDEQCLSYLKEWIKVNKIEVYTIMDIEVNT